MKTSEYVYLLEELLKDLHENPSEHEEIFNGFKQGYPKLASELLDIMP